MNTESSEKVDRQGGAGAWGGRCEWSRRVGEVHVAQGVRLLRVFERTMLPVKVQGLECMFTCS